MIQNVCGIENGSAVSLGDIPSYPVERFIEIVGDLICRHQARLCCFFVMPESRPLNPNVKLRLAAVLAGREARLAVVMSTPLTSPSYPSLTPICPEAHLFEREIAEQWGITPLNHPWLKPVRFCQPYFYPAGGKDPFDRQSDVPVHPGEMNFFEISGNDMHEIGLGPVYGILNEPVHYRFQVCGNQVFFLENAMGYQHRRLESRFIGGPFPNTMNIAETISGDSAVAHGIACVQVMESLGKVDVTERGNAMRGILLELERIGKHVRTTVAMADSISFAPTVAMGRKVRSAFADIIGHIAGNRLGRHFIYPGGVSTNISETFIAAIGVKLGKSATDYNQAVSMFLDCPSAVRKLRCGILTPEFAKSTGIVGVPARACGLKQDVRSDYPTGVYQSRKYFMVTDSGGDSGARLRMCRNEIQASTSFIIDTLASLPDDAPSSFDGNCLPCQLTLSPDTLAISLVEGGHGEICHIGVTDEQGKILLYKITTPSFRNFTALTHVMRNEALTYFPLIQASFDLSVCGHDL